MAGESEAGGELINSAGADRMRGAWRRWGVDLPLAQKYYVESVVKQGSLLEIILAARRPPEEDRVLITFLEPVISYQEADEAMRYATILDLHQVYGRDFYARWTIFTVESSPYLQLIAGVEQPRKFEHFAILGSETLLEVIAAVPPSVEKIGFVRCQRSILGNDVA